MELVYPADPIFDPCTVTLADPVPARFVRSTTLTMPRSAEYTLVKLPDRRPVVSDTRRVPITERPIWHCTDVSDPHVVRSHDVCPTRAAEVYVADPMFAPCSVTLVDPVEAEFARGKTLKLPMSTEKAWVTLPDRIPNVSDVRRVDITDCADWHRIDVSEAHVVCSHAVCPILTELV